MANNRLIVGNKDSGEFLCVGKGLGMGWPPLDEKQVVALNALLTGRCSYAESDVGKLTNLIFCTEYDKRPDGTYWYDWFLKEGYDLLRVK